MFWKILKSKYTLLHAYNAAHQITRSKLMRSEINTNWKFLYVEINVNEHNIN